MLAAKKQVWLGFRVLCLLSGSGWVLDAWRPEALSGLTRTGVHLGVLAVVFWAAARVRREAFGAGWMRVAGWGAALLAVPQAVIAGAGGRLSSLTEVLVLGLVPVVVVFAAAQGAAGFGLEESPLTALGWALAGLGGLALLVPFAWPGGGAGAAWLAALVCAAALAGVAAVRLYGLLGAGGLLAGAAVMCGAGAAASALVAVGLGGGGVVDWDAGVVATEAARCLLVDGPVLLLTVWLLREMTPVRFAARYLVVPLVTIVEGFLLVRPAWSWTMGAGFLLLAGGCAGLLRADSGEVQPGL